MEGQVITLSGRGLYSGLNLVTGEQKLDKNDQPYYWYSYGGKIVTIREDVHNLLQKAAICDLNLVSTSREVDVLDAESGEPTGEKALVTGFGYAGHLTYEQAKALTRNEGELKGIEMQVAKELELDLQA